MEQKSASHASADGKKLELACSLRLPNRSVATPVRWSTGRAAGPQTPLLRMVLVQLEGSKAQCMKATQHGDGALRLGLKSP